MENKIDTPKLPSLVEQMTTHDKRLEQYAPTLEAATEKIKNMKSILKMETRMPSPSPFQDGPNPFNQQ